MAVQDKPSNEDNTLTCPPCTADTASTKAPSTTATTTTSSCTSTATCNSPVVIVREEAEDGGSKAYHYDPTARSCGWCYAVLPSSTCTTVKCASCPRLYCTNDCRSLDEESHHFWCGKAGEKGVDFAIAAVPNKGMGLVTRRSFQRGEKILTERPVLTTHGLVPPVTPNSDDMNTSIRIAAMALTPLDGNLDDKVNANGVSVGGQHQHQPTPAQRNDNGETKEDTQEDEDTSSSPYVNTHANTGAGLFLTFSRVNHDCVGNSDHYFDHQHGVEVLVANTEIAAGTEITFPYTRTGKDRIADLAWRGFVCDCRACHHPTTVGAKLEQVKSLEQTVMDLGGQPCDTLRQTAVNNAYAMLELFEELKVSDREFARAHYDLFQILVLQHATVQQANVHMSKAHEHAQRFCGYDEHEIVSRFKHYCDHPEEHLNYRSID